VPEIVHITANTPYDEWRDQTFTRKIERPMNIED